MTADPHRITELTDAQREVLRLWYGRPVVKEVARELGISPYAVNERLRGARRILGTHSSSEAATLLWAVENSGGYIIDGYSAKRVAGAEEPVAVPDPAGGDQHPRPGEFLLQEERLPFVGSAAASSPWPRLPIPRFRGDRNDLSIRARLLWIGALTAGVAIIVGALVSIADGAGRIVAHLIRAAA